jgi:hypothetical protein
MSLNDLLADFIIEGCIRYHQSRHYESVDVFIEKVSDNLGKKNLREYLEKKGLELKNYYKNLANNENN